MKHLRVADCASLLTPDSASNARYCATPTRKRERPAEGPKRRGVPKNPCLGKAAPTNAPNATVNVEWAQLAEASATAVAEWARLIEANPLLECSSGVQAALECRERLELEWCCPSTPVSWLHNCMRVGFRTEAGRPIRTQKFVFGVMLKDRQLLAKLARASDV